MHALIMALLLLVMPPCVTEDSSGCVWDASTQGNGIGMSFVVIDDITYYLP